MMPKYIEIAMDNNAKLYIATSEFPSANNSSIYEERANNSDGIIQKSQEYLSGRIGQIKDFSSQILESLKEFVHQPDEFEVTFSVGFAADAGIIISKFSSEASIEVTMKWSKEKC